MYALAEKTARRSWEAATLYVRPKGYIVGNLTYPEMEMK